MVAEGPQGSDVVRYPIVVVVATQHTAQPLAHYRNRLVQVCFVYDPTGIIPNPRGIETIETDLSRDGSPFPVRVLIRP